MSCPALAAFGWPEDPDARFDPHEGWFEWERNMAKSNIFAQTLRTLRSAEDGTAPWLPVDQGNAVDVTGPSLRGRPP
eukprot:7885544-Pyramimonas_sp.AAC.1